VKKIILLIGTQGGQLLANRDVGGILVGSGHCEWLMLAAARARA
tara:strand:- start:1985 stop:2116 length:132 start_codon:yes stop_codon:yes gene_type:complete